MLRISALNDTASSEEDPRKIQLSKTKEAKEAEAFAVYNKALLYQQQGSTTHAEKLLRNLCEHPLLKEASELVDDDVDPSNHRGLQLLYSIHKNLASILLQREKLQEAMASYIEAVRIDSSEVTVWYKMGQIARKLHNYPLAKICFQQGLQCNANHWPCLDNAITVTFALGDYLMCLEHISSALEKDCNYSKGLCLRKQILKEQPSLEAITKELFLYCDPKIHITSVDEAESKEYLDEALKIRVRRRQLAEEDREKEAKPATFLKPLIPFTWKNIGEQLIALYDDAVKSDPPKSLGLEVDLRDYYFLNPSLFLCESNTDARDKNTSSNTTMGINEKVKKKVLPTLNTSKEMVADNPFQRVNEFSGTTVTAAPNSLYIGDDAKESALMNRLCGRQVQGETSTSLPKSVGNGDKSSHATVPLVQETRKEDASSAGDLEAMDIDLPLLRDEDMALALKMTDIRKGDLKPELLLKEDEEDLLGLTEGKSLETVLSSVIDMEFGNVEVNKRSENSQNVEEMMDLTDVDVQPREVEATLTVNLDFVPDPPDVFQKSVPSTIEAQSKTQQSREESQLAGQKTPDPCFPSPSSSAQMTQVKSTEQSQSAQVTTIVTPSIVTVSLPVTEVSAHDVKAVEQIPLSLSIPLSQGSTESKSSIATMQSETEPQASSPKFPIFPSKETFSPIAASLLSPSDKSCASKSISVYHSVLSSLGNTDSELISKSVSDASSHQRQELKRSPTVSKSHQSGSGTFNPKVYPKSPSLKSSSQDRRSAGDFIEGVVRSQLKMDQQPQSLHVGIPSKSNPPQISLPKSSPHHMSSSKSSPHHNSPLKPSTHQVSPSWPGSVEKPKRSQASQQSPTHCLPSQSTHMSLSGQKGLMSPPNSRSPIRLSTKSPQQNHPSHSVPKLHVSSPHLSPDLAYLSQMHHGSPLSKERLASLSLPQHQLNALSALEAQALLQGSMEGQAALRAELDKDILTAHLSSMARSRPSPLLRSYSLPGHFSQPTEMLMPTYLSPPTLPCTSVSPFFSSSTDLPRILSQSSAQYGFLPTSSGIFARASSFPPYPLVSHPHELSPLHYPSSLYSNLLHPQASSTPFPIPQTATISDPLHLYRQQAAVSRANKQSPKDTKSSHDSNSPHSSPSRQSNLPTTSSSSSATLSKKHSPSSRPLTSASSGQPVLLASTAGSKEDHSYHQKRGLLYQAMIESMLETGTSSAQSTQVTSTSTASSGKKPGGSRGGNTGGGSATRRGPKRKLDDAGTDDCTNALKRRSTRSRSTRTKKDEPSVDYQKLMRKYFPKSLLYMEDDDSEEIEKEKSDEAIANGVNTVEKKKKEANASPQLLATTEEEDVKNFVKSSLKGHGILDLIYKYLLALALKIKVTWYKGIAEIFLQLYERLRKHLTIPIVLGGNLDFPADGLREYALIILVQNELFLDAAITGKDTQNLLCSPSKSGSSDPEDMSLLGEFHCEDVFFLSSMTSQSEALGDCLNEFNIRLYWLKARQHQLIHQVVDAVDCYEIVSELLSELEPRSDEVDIEFEINLPNLSHDGEISLSEVKRHLESLQRSKCLEDTQKMFDEGDYARVVDNLMPTFDKKITSPKCMTERERPSQLLLLQNSLYKLGRRSECMRVAEVSLNEAVVHYKRVPTLPLRQEWGSALVSLFSALDQVMEEDKEILKVLNQKGLVRLAHNLVAVIEISLDVADSVTEMPIGSVLPWKILFRILKQEEQKNKAERMDTDQGKESNKEDEELSPSLTMLIEGHEHLGRHSWCTKDEGQLLLFLLSVLEAELDLYDEDAQEEVTQAFEQCIYCLYGHPNKRGKARHLNDHNAAQVSLTWKRAGPVFHYFAPETVPEFDSYKTSTVSSDVENLLRRIYALIPEPINPAHQDSVAAVTNYVEGQITTAPNSSPAANKSEDPYNMCALVFYLLGDFFFKNKEPAKAVKFYQLDLSVNPLRLDSWAGLGLAKMSQIEQKLSSTELKMDASVYKKSDMALRCFCQAVTLESKSRKLWLEYGSLAYQLHSHSSRQIKYRNMFPISEEFLQSARTRRIAMLNLAKDNFFKASECECDGSEDDWLTHYMLGKVAEKEGSAPAVYLEHYKQAALCLYEENVVYPKKIQFSSSPPHLALEALEVFYRIHAAVLKLLLSEQCTDHLSILDKYVSESLNSNFARGEEKRHELLEEEREPSSKSNPASSSTSSKPKTKRVCHKNPVDHEYSYYKSASDSQSSDLPEGESTRGQTSAVQILSNLSDQTIGDEREVESQDEKEADGKEAKSEVVSDVKVEEDVEMMDVQGSADDGENARESLSSGEGRKQTMTDVPYFSEEKKEIASQLIDDGNALMNRSLDVTSPSSPKEYRVTRENQVKKTNTPTPPSSQLHSQTSDDDAEIMSTENEGDLDILSCGNEADVDTDVMEVEDEDGFLSTAESELSQVSAEEEGISSSQLSETSVFSSNVTVTAQSDGNEVMEVHAGGSETYFEGEDEDKNFVTHVQSLSKQISEGFIPGETPQSCEKEVSGIAFEKVDMNEEVLDTEVVSSQKLFSCFLPKTAANESQKPIDRGSVPSQNQFSDGFSPNTEPEGIFSENFVNLALSEDSDWDKKRSKFKSSQSSQSQQSEDMTERPLQSVDMQSGNSQIGDEFKNSLLVKTDAASEKESSDSDGQRSMTSEISPSVQEIRGAQDLKSVEHAAGDKPPLYNLLAGEKCSSNVHEEKKEKWENEDKEKDKGIDEAEVRETKGFSEMNLSGSKVSDTENKETEILERMNFHNSNKDVIQDKSNSQQLGDKNLQEEQRKSLKTGSEIEDMESYKEISSLSNTSEQTEKSNVPDFAKRQENDINKEVSLSQQEIINSDPFTQALSGEDVSAAQKVLSTSQESFVCHPSKKAGFPLRQASPDSLEGRDAGTDFTEEKEKMHKDELKKEDVENIDKKLMQSTDENLGSVENKEDPPNNGPEESQKDNRGKIPEIKDMDEKQTGKSHRMVEDSANEINTKVASKTDLHSSSGDRELENSVQECEKSIGTKIDREQADTTKEKTENVKEAGQERLGEGGDKKKGEKKEEQKDLGIWKVEVSRKCLKGLELCASRFPSHYKSLYRLAYFYYHSPEQRNLQYARDLLLGRPDWQELSHMPAPGLFQERKGNNFFQGFWKIPIEDIDRSGCFPSHVHRSVQLLLDVLMDMEDLEMLKQLRSQLKRMPDSGKKYLRDAERLVLAEEAFCKSISVVERQMDRSDQWSESQKEEQLVRVYQVWQSSKGGKRATEAGAALLRAFKIMMKGRTDVNRLTQEQAVLYCQQNLPKVSTPSSSYQSPWSSQSGSRSGVPSGSEKGKAGLSGPVMSLDKTIKSLNVTTSIESCTTSTTSESQKHAEQTYSKSTDKPVRVSASASSSVTKVCAIPQEKREEKDESVIVISDAE